MNHIKRPLPLSPGDRVAVIAPASPPNEERAMRGMTYLESLGLQVGYNGSLTRTYGYLAGKDEERLAELHEAFAAPDVKAIFCAGGGYGTGRIAARIDYDLIARHPKIFWGYSDITFLLNSIFKKTGLITFHGPMLASDLGKEGVHPYTLQSLAQLFTPRTIRYTEEISPLEVISEGEAEGVLVGGNLSLLVSTLGTPFEIDTRGKLLFIEEIGEAPYRIDRMLNQLKMAGKLDEAAGFLLCDFHNCEPEEGKASLTLTDLFHHYIAPMGKPALSGFKIGHSSPNIAVPIGVAARISTSAKSFTTLEPAVFDE